MSADLRRYEHELAGDLAPPEHILDTLPPSPNKPQRIIQCGIADVDKAVARAIARAVARVHGQMPIERKLPRFTRGRRCVG
jgi:hypothetical protein